jgi:hypothetical protein
MTVFSSEARNLDLDIYCVYRCLKFTESNMFLGLIVRFLPIVTSPTIQTLSSSAFS